MTHDDLVESLAGHLVGPERMVWSDMQLGPSGSPRPDVYTLFKSFVRPSPMAYECKVSRSDFRADATAGKWQSYLKYAGGVYFACESGLIDKREVPEQCGLIVLTNGRWRAAKKPIVQTVEIPRNAWLKLLIDGIGRQGTNTIRTTRGVAWHDTTKQNKRFGEIAAKVIRDRFFVEREIADVKATAKRIEDDARREAERIRKESTDSVGPLRSELAAILGLLPTADKYELAHAVNRLRADLVRHPAERALETMTNQLRNTLDHYGYKPGGLTE